MVTAWHYDGHLEQDNVVVVLYHIIWSFIRPCSALLFLVYWLMHLPFLRSLQALVCGVGFVHFAFFAPLTETARTYHGGTRFSVGLPVERTHLGLASHRVESLCFCLSIALFFLHGVCSGNWAKAGQALPRALSFLASLLFGLFFVAKLTWMVDMPWVTDLLHHHYFWSFVLMHYGLGYFAILFINVGLFESSAWDRVTFHRLVITAGPRTSGEQMLPQ